MPAKVDYVPVYSINENRRLPAKSSIPRVEAEAYEKDGIAKFNDKRTVLIMKKLDFEMYRPAQSLKPNVHIMDAFVEGKPFAVAIVNSWAFAL